MLNAQKFKETELAKSHKYYDGKNVIARYFRGLQELRNCDCGHVNGGDDFKTLAIRQSHYVQMLKFF
jgi:hypothetical protein